VSDQLGFAAVVAARLFSALEDWARHRAGGLIDQEHLANGSASCQVCPLCQAVTALRAVRPETVEHLLDAAASFVAALRSTVAPGGGDPGGPPKPGVQHIDVREG
jgi:hypothetical protein